uniref:EOG090X07YB n=1 Tax=Eubosmina coregoni TaxID=186181 RepID=A0A4Y7LMN1_9CRUS|nr:EOG090X07YB [Eubosmina coregoni]SVE69861.1 EOG090X07YB [Eubosmina coregoni]
MFGVILFDNHDDLCYVYSDDEFKSKIERVATDLNINRPEGSSDDHQETGQKSTTNSGVEALAVMQMFSPLLTLKHSETHAELVTLLIATFLKLRDSSLSVITESLHYEPISEDVNASIMNVLQGAIADLKAFANISESRAHILLIRDTSIVALYSGRDTIELKIEEVLFLVIVANAFAHSSSSTRNSLVILESCVPYSIHIQRVENGLTILILIEAS